MQLSEKYGSLSQIKLSTDLFIFQLLLIVLFASFYL